MKKKFILAFLLISMLFLCSCSDKATEGLEFEQQDGVYIVTGYHGTDVDVIIPDTYNDVPVTAISNSCFRESDIQSIEIGDYVEIIGTNAFADSTLLKKVSLPASLQKLDSFCFENCISLETVTFDRNCVLHTIECAAFSGCTNLKNIELPSQLNYIDWSTFENCTSLKSIEIPASVYFVGEDAFSGFTTDQKIIVMGSTDNWEYTPIINGELTWYDGCEAEIVYKNSGFTANGNTSEHTPTSTTPSESSFFGFFDSIFKTGIFSIFNTMLS